MKTHPQCESWEKVLLEKKIKNKNKKHLEPVDLSVQ